MMLKNKFDFSVKQQQLRSMLMCLRDQKTVIAKEGEGEDLEGDVEEARKPT